MSVCDWSQSIDGFLYYKGCCWVSQLSKLCTLSVRECSTSKFLKAIHAIYMPTINHAYLLATIFNNNLLRNHSPRQNTYNITEAPVDLDWTCAQNRNTSNKAGEPWRGRPETDRNGWTLLLPYALVYIMGMTDWLPDSTKIPMQCKNTNHSTLCTYV